MKEIISSLFILIFVTSCATPHVVSVVGPNDNSMNCAQLDTEISIAMQYSAEAKKEKNLGTATNIGALFFWLPGMVATQMNANEAIKAANDRAAHLARIKAKKSC